MVELTDIDLDKAERQMDAKNVTLTDADLDKAETAITNMQKPSPWQLAKEGVIGAVHVPDIMARGALKGLGLLSRFRPATQFLLTHDPIPAWYQGVQKTPAGKVGEFVGSFAMPFGEFKAASMLGKLAESAAQLGGYSGLGYIGSEEKPTVSGAAQAAGLGAGLGAAGRGLVEAGISPIMKGIAQSKIGQTLSNSFGKLIGKLRGGQSEAELNSELQNVATQVPQSNEFVGGLLGDKNFTDESIKGNPERLRDEVKKLNEYVNTESKKRYNEAESLAQKGGKFLVTFPTASESAKSILGKEKEFALQGVPKADIDKVLPTIQGISEGGFARDAKTGKIIKAKPQTFESATESIKRLKEMASKFTNEKNLTAASKLSSLAAAVESDTEDALAKSSPRALDKWRESQQYWKNNVLPLRTQGIQKAMFESGEIGNLHKELLNKENLDLPAVLDQLSPQGKNALAYQYFSKAVEQPRGIKGKQVNPKKLVSLFSDYDNQSLPFMESVLGRDKIDDLRDIAADRLVGVDENPQRISAGLSNPINSESFRKLPQQSKNIILYHHFKNGITNGEVDENKLARLFGAIAPQNRSALADVSTESSLKELQDALMSSRASKKPLTPRQKQLQSALPALATLAGAGAGYGTGGMLGLLGGAAVPAGVRALRAVIPPRQALTSLLALRELQRRLAPLIALKTFTGENQ
jgi:hypothetical protein